MLYNKGDGNHKKLKRVHITLRPCAGDLLIASAKEGGKVIATLNLRTDMMSVYASFRTEFLGKGLHCLEVCGYGEDDDDQVIYLAFYDSDTATRWLEYMSKAKKFSEWYTHIQSTFK